MATTLTKNVLPIGQYQEWGPSDITAGDILDVYTSLGGRVAHTVTIKSMGGDTTVRFNVAKSIYQEHGHLHNSWIPYSPSRGGYLVAEVEEDKPDVLVESGSVQTWSASEIPIYDIKVTTKASQLRIIVT